MFPLEHSSTPNSLLYVEDDSCARESTLRALGRRFPSLQLYGAENGARGLESFREHRPDIVLTDIKMPEMDGILMAQEILSLSPATRIIVVSSHSEINYLLDTMRSGIRHYLMKPLDCERLGEAVSECLAQIELERQIRHQEQCIRILSQAVEQSSKVVVITDREGRILYVNRRFGEATGYGAEEIVGKGLQELNPHDGASFPELWQTVRSGSEWHGESLNRKKNGEAYWESVSVSPLFDTEGKIGHFVTIREDVTSRRRRQEELERVQRLESLGVVAGGIAHDFNNILTGILGNISFAQALAGESPELRGSLVEAEKASLRAADLARQLLTFAHGGKPMKQQVSVRQLVDQAVALTLGRGGIQGEVAIPDEIHALEVDPAQIQQAFRNILLNAMEASPAGPVTVAAENVTLAERNELELPPGSYVRISFSDRGCGIPEKEQQRIFDPYFSTKPGGTGLGLTSAHSIVTRHGGHIAVHSSPATGATFVCYLPSTGGTLLPVEKKARKQVAQQPQGGAVLVMDDESVVRKVTGKMLECLGYRVTTCSNGESAIELYRKAHASAAPYKAVIMDLTVVGGMGGKEAAQHILALDPQARLVVSSGYFDDPVLADYREHGFCAVLPKPYKSADLAEVIGSL